MSCGSNTGDATVRDCWIDGPEYALSFNSLNAGYNRGRATAERCWIRSVGWPWCAVTGITVCARDTILRECSLMVSATTATIGIDVILFDTDYTDGLTAAKYAQQQALIENCMVFVDNDTGSATGIRSFTRAYIRGGAIMTNGTPSVDILAHFVDDVTIDSLAYDPTKVQSGETAQNGTAARPRLSTRASEHQPDLSTYFQSSAPTPARWQTTCLRGHRRHRSSARSASRLRPPRCWL